jgi:hypothetical protein
MFGSVAKLTILTSCKKKALLDHISSDVQEQISAAAGATDSQSGPIPCNLKPPSPKQCHRNQLLKKKPHANFWTDDAAHVQGLPCTNHSSNVVTMTGRTTGQHLTHSRRQPHDLLF